VATTETPPAPPRRDRRWAAGIATVVAVPVALVVLAVLVSTRFEPDQADPAPTGTAAAALPPVRVPAPPALSAGAQKACQELVSALPTDLGDLPARPVDSPSPYVAAWGEPAVTLRCGVARPPSFLATAEVQVINGVTWFPERRGDRTAWTAVDRPVYVEVVAPFEAASAPAARLSTAVTRALPARTVDPAD
jgi:hypothetical protein